MKKLSLICKNPTKEDHARKTNKVESDAKTQMDTVDGTTVDLTGKENSPAQMIQEKDLPLLDQLMICQLIQCQLIQSTQLILQLISQPGGNKEDANKT